MKRLSTAVDHDLVDLMSAVFADHRTQHEASGDTAVLDRDLWTQLDELGLVRLTGGEDDGGSGAGWLEAAELLRAAARNGIRLPLAEHDLLACPLLAEAGLPIDAALRTVCVLDDAGVSQAVPWASQSAKIVTVWKRDGAYLAADLDPAALDVTPGTNLAGEPRDTVRADPVALHGVPVSDAVIEQLHRKRALVRAVQVSAVLDRIVELSIEHTTVRTQFGRPIAAFQAVQQQIADMAAEAALAGAATTTALTTAVATDWAAPKLDFLIAAARSCAGHAASVVVRPAKRSA